MRISDWSSDVCSSDLVKRATASAPALKDPVCGMSVTEQSPHHLEHDGQSFYFCSMGCQAKFSADPAKYLSKKRPNEQHTEAAAPGMIYTCHMSSEEGRVGKESVSACS